MCKIDAGRTLNEEPRMNVCFESTESGPNQTVDVARAGYTPSPTRANRAVLERSLMLLYCTHDGRIFLASGVRRLGRRGHYPSRGIQYRHRRGCMARRQQRRTRSVPSHRFAPTGVSDSPFEAISTARSPLEGGQVELTC